jgi:hypothetical protein
VVKVHFVVVPPCNYSESITFVVEFGQFSKGIVFEVSNCIKGVIIGKGMVDILYKLFKD